MKHIFCTEQIDKFIDSLIEEAKNRNISDFEEDYKKCLIQTFKNLMLLNVNLEVELFLSKLSNVDRTTFNKIKITDIFNITTPNRLYTESIKDENAYTKKIIEFLEKVKLGITKRGSYTKNILLDIGGNPDTLRRILLDLETQEIVYSMGFTRNKSWVLSKYKIEAIKNWKKELEKK